MERTQQRYRQLAERLSASRAATAAELSAAVSRMMQELGMRGGRFKVDIATHQGEPTRYGYDRIEFQISATTAMAQKLQ